MVLGEGVVLDQNKIGGGVVVDWWWIGWIRCYFVVLHIVNVLADSPFIKNLSLSLPPQAFPRRPQWRGNLDGQRNAAPKKIP